MRDIESVLIVVGLLIAVTVAGVIKAYAREAYTEHCRTIIMRPMRYPDPEPRNGVEKWLFPKCIPGVDMPEQETIPSMKR
jgi:hypothetical protein